MELINQTENNRFVSIENFSSNVSEDYCLFSIVYKLIFRFLSRWDFFISIRNLFDYQLIFFSLAERQLISVKSSVPGYERWVVLSMHTIVLPTVRLFMYVNDSKAQAEWDKSFYLRSQLRYNDFHVVSDRYETIIK